MTTMAQARDAVMGVFAAAWTTYPAVYDDVTATVPSGSTPWAQVEVTNLGAVRSSIARPAKWENRGRVRIQINTPFGDGLVLADTLAQSVLDAYRSANLDSVWFSDCQAVEVGHVGEFFVIDVTADILYYNAV